MAVIMACAWGGSGHYLVKDNITGADVRGSHTIMVRAKWTATTTTASYFAAVLCTSAATSGGFVGRLASDPDGTNRSRGARFNTTPTYNKVSDAGSFGDTTTWRHLTMVYNASTQIVEYYIDGVSIGTISSTTSFVAADTAGAFGILATGKFADLALFNRALTAGEVLSMASYRVQQVTSNCLGFWRMDTNSTGGTAEGSAADSSGAGNTLTANTSSSPGFTFSTADNPPQPEVPPLDFASEGDTSTSGSAAVGISYAKTAAGSASTSGTAAVSKSNVVATASAQSTGLADVFKPGGQGWRAPPASVVNVASSGRTFALPSAFSTCVWVRRYRSSTASATLVAGVFNGTDPSVSIRLGATGSTHYIGVDDTTPLTVVNLTPTTALGDWVHLAVTYDGTNLRSYVDAVLVNTTAYTLATGPTSRVLYPNIICSTGSFADFAQYRGWTNVTLSAGEIADERASALSISQLSNVVWDFLLFWDNPSFDNAYYGDFASFDSLGGDSNNGPNNPFPPVEPDGESSTSGTAAVSIVHGLGVCTGSASTSGSAAVGLVISPTGSTTTSGAAAVNRVFALGAVTGGSSTNGAAAIAAAAALAATGSASTSGATSFTLRVAGSASTSGSAAVAVSYNFASAGAATTSGSAAVSSAAAIAATSSTQTTGNVPGITLGISASGGTSTTGSATQTAAASISAAGATQTSGSASPAGTLQSDGQTSTSGSTLFDAVVFPVVAAGSSTTSGDVAVSGAFPLSADGSASTSGSAPIAAAANLVSTGSGSTSGAASFALIVNGVAQATGAASLSALASLVAGGSATTSGNASLGLGISPAGQNSTSGDATMTVVASIAATGSNIATGNAAFAGVAPPSVGGAGGNPDAQRRAAAIGAGRRRIR